MKTFGSATPIIVAREPFKLYAERDGEIEEHTFTAAPRLSAQDIIVGTQAEKDPEKGMDAVLRILRKSIVDDDGVKASWAVKELPAAPRDEIVASHGYPDHSLVRSAVQEPLPPGFRGPDGHIYRMDDAAAIERFTAVDAGSSRRRWDHLMLHDDSVDVEFGDLIEIMKWMIGLATDRPTESSASSSR